MKRLSMFLAILIVFSVLQAQFPPQPEKEALLRLNRAEMEAVYQIIDDAAAPGNIRKPLLQKFAVAYETTWPSRPAPAPVKQDTTKPKSKKN